MTRELAEQDLQRPLKGLGNAILLSGSDGSLRLLFVTIAMGRWSGSQLNTCLSTDGGITWSPARRLTLSPFFNFSDLVRNRAISLAGGGWCVPIYQEFLGKFPELLWIKESKGHLEYCKSRIAGGCSTFQPSLVPLDDTRLIAFLRDYTGNRKIFISRSDNGGGSWSRPVASQLPNPDAGVSGLRLSDGKLLLAYNDSSACRENLALALSRDEGKNWEKLAKLEQESGSSFSYPFLIRSQDGLINLAYTYKGKGIALTEFNEAWVADILSSLSRSKITPPQP
jgi:predicted neuraminidase